MGKQALLTEEFYLTNVERKRETITIRQILQTAAAKIHQQMLQLLGESLKEQYQH